MHVTVHARPCAVYFDRNSATVRSEFYPDLGEIAGVLRQWPEWQLLLRGYADGTGKEIYNLSLSAVRAKAVKRVLVEHHVAGNRLITVGAGIAPEIGNPSREQRRVEFVMQQTLKPGNPGGAKPPDSIVTQERQAFSHP